MLCSLHNCLPPIVSSPCPPAPGVQPMEDAWSEECLLTLRQVVSNRILRMEILGERKGTALVALSDMASDPQASVAELLLSAGYAAPATVCHQEAEQTATAAVEPQGKHSSTLLLGSILIYIILL